MELVVLDSWKAELLSVVESGEGEAVVFVGVEELGTTLILLVHFDEEGRGIDDVVPLEISGSQPGENVHKLSVVG